MGKLVLSAKEKRRLELFRRVKRGEISVHKAAELLDLSYRQAKRSYARYEREGASGLGHRLRGRGSNRRIEAEKRSKSHTKPAKSAVETSANRAPRASAHGV